MDLKRAQWIDSCRFFAIFVIMVTHFIAKVCPEVLMLWETPPTSWLLYGLTGKFSVAFFFVILGYFASRPANFKVFDFAKYTLRRYLHFAFYIFVCTAIYIIGCYGTTWLFHAPDEFSLRVISDGFRYNLVYLLRDSLLFEDNYNATLWCMQQLFIASLLCKLLAYIPERITPLLRICLTIFAILVLMCIDGEFFVWICAAMLGYILRLCLHWFEIKRFRPNAFHLASAFIAALILIKIRLDEGVLQYSMQAIAAFLLILIQFNIQSVKRILSVPPFPWLGGISMGMFVVHTPVYSLLHSSAYAVLSRHLPISAAILIYFVLAIAASVLCAFLLKMLYEAVSKVFSKARVSA